MIVFLTDTFLMLVLKHSFVLMQLPDYLEIVEHPMDFGTVRKKLDKGRYSNLEEFEVGYGLYSPGCLQCVVAVTVHFFVARNIPM